MNDAFFKVNAVPGQTDQFSAPEAGEEVHKDQVLEFFSLEGGKEAFLFFLV